MKDRVVQSGQRLSRLHVALGTFVAIDTVASSVRVADDGVAAAFAAVAAVERLMHPSRAGSDVAALNDANGEAWISVQPWTFEVLELCHRLHRASDGIFDPCLDTALGRWPDIELRAGGGVRSRVPVRVDLGGIAKGYAVDRALEALKSCGCEAGLVNAGGDLAVFGGDGHEILRREGAGPLCSLLELRDGALATSTVDGTTRPPEHRGYYHGRTRREISSGSISVIAPSAAIADALTKCLLFADPATEAALLATFAARRLETCR